MIHRQGATGYLRHKKQLEALEIVKSYPMEPLPCVCGADDDSLDEESTLLAALTDVQDIMVIGPPVENVGPDITIVCMSCLDVESESSIKPVVEVFIKDF